MRLARMRSFNRFYIMRAAAQTRPHRPGAGQAAGQRRGRLAGWLAGELAYWLAGWQTGRLCSKLGASGNVSCEIMSAAEFSKLANEQVRVLAEAGACGKRAANQGAAANRRRSSSASSETLA